MALSIGIVGGTSPESTAHYYLHIVHRHFRERGDHAYPRILIASLSFQQMLDWQEAGAFAQAAGAISRECRALAAAGADFVLIAANALHKYLPAVESPLPILSIYDAVSRAAAAGGVKRLGLTGTRFTMSEGFYKDSLEERGLEVIVPEADAQALVHRIIFGELVKGVVSEEARRDFDDVCRGLAARGAQAVLLGCTELGMLREGRVPPVPLLDSMQLHADAAWERAV